MVIAPDYVDGGDFVDGRAPAAINDGFWGYIDHSGDLVFPRKPILKSAGRFGDGLAPVRLNGDVGFMNENGWAFRSITKPDGSEREIRTATPFHDGRAAVNGRGLSGSTPPARWPSTRRRADGCRPVRTACRGFTTGCCRWSSGMAAISAAVAPTWPTKAPVIRAAGRTGCSGPCHRSATSWSGSTARARCRSIPPPAGWTPALPLCPSAPTMAASPPGPTACRCRGRSRASRARTAPMPPATRRISTCPGAAPPTRAGRGRCRCRAAGGGRTNRSI